MDDLRKRVNLKENRALLTLVTFAPPLLFALFWQEAFTAALGYAGLLFAYYGIILPVLLAWRARVVHPNLPYRVIGGNVALILAFIAGVIIIIIPFLDLPKVVG